MQKSLLPGGENIRVIGRFRPPNARELAIDGGRTSLRFDEGRRTVWLGLDESAPKYTLDAVLPPEATQADVYAETSGIVDAVMQGYNATLLAYGQTGSGKTHSVIGVLGGLQEGLLPRAVRAIFDAIREDTSETEFAVSCSYLEIYKEVVRDLLQPSSKPGGLAIREDLRGNKGVYVDGLKEVCVMGERGVLECMQCGNASRAVGTTAMNAQSSRSHALLTITVQQKLPDGSTKVSKLNMADLAGSEKVSKTGASGETLEEAKKINASLSALCLVISSLSDGCAHIPYRNSKLTRILQESLGGNSKTMMIVNCSLAADNAPETQGTLRFAMRAKNVKNAAVVNRVLSQAQLEAANAALKAEVRALQQEVASLRSGGSSEACRETTSRKRAREDHDAGRSMVASGKAAEEVARLTAALGEANEKLAAAQAEVAEGREAASEASTALKEREELCDMLLRFQELHGCSPTVQEGHLQEGRGKEGGEKGRRSIESLRQQLVDTEAAAALQREVGAADGDVMSDPVERLRAQVAEQERRIAFLEPRAQVAERAEEEAAVLKEHLTSLVQSKVEQMPLSVQAEPKYVRGSMFKAVWAGDFTATMNEHRLEVTRAMNSLFSWGKSYGPDKQ